MGENMKCVYVHAIMSNGSLIGILRMHSKWTKWVEGSLGFDVAHAYDRCATMARTVQ